MALNKKPIRIELPTVFGMKTVNCYLFKEPEPTLIDCGENTDKSWHALVSGLELHGLAPNDLSRIIVTHAHVDHMGMASRLADASMARIWVNERSVEWATDVAGRWKTRGKVMHQLIHRLLTGETAQTVALGLQAMGKQMAALWPPVDSSRICIFPMEGSIEIGGEDWQILYLPGHSNTQTCFFNAASGHFLSADMLLRITPTPVMEEDADRPGHREVGLLKMMNSYKIVRGLPISSVFPGHYEVFDNAIETIDRQTSRIHKRKHECLEYIRQGQSDFLQLYRSLYGKSWNLPAFNMLIGYLDLLHHEKKVDYLPIDTSLRIVSVN